MLDLKSLPRSKHSYALLLGCKGKKNNTKQKTRYTHIRDSVYV